MKNPSVSPVSFPVSVVRLPQKGLPVAIEADAEQRALLAEAHGLLSVERFRADLLVAKWKGDGVEVSGRLEADITQACVVSLDPVPAHIGEDISAILVPEESRLARHDFRASGEILLAAEGPDSPETFSGDRIDVGALAEEFFALAIDPYPRKEGVSLESGAADEAGASAGGPLAEKLAAFRRGS